MQLTQQPECNLRADIELLTEHWREFRRAKREMNFHWGQVRRICRAHCVDLRKPIVFLLLLLLVGCSTSPQAPMPPKPVPVLTAPRMARAAPEANALPLPNDWLAWTHPYPMTVNFVVYETQDLKNWRQIGLVTAPAGVDTPTVFELPYSIRQTTNHHAIWRVGARWKP